MPPLSEAFAIAAAHRQSGRLGVAEEICRRILAAEPDHADAMHLLGFAAYQAGDHATALRHIGRAMAIRPTHAGYANDLGLAWKAQGDLDRAIACYRRAIELEPDFAIAHSNLGEALRLQGKPAEAAACGERAVELSPNLAEIHNNLGNALKELGKPEEAILCFQRALQLKPHRAAFQYNLGTALGVLGRPHEAMAAYQRAIELDPDFTEAYVNFGRLVHDQGRPSEAIGWYQRALQRNPGIAVAYHNLGNALADLGKPEDAAECYQRALEIDPACAEAHQNLGRAFQDLGRLDEAIACYRRALEVKPSFAEGHANLGNALKDQGDLDAAILCYRRALELKPDFAAAHSNLIYAMHLCPGQTAQSIYAEYRQWNEQHAQPLAESIRSHPNDRSPDRRLRIGYVSPDLRQHPVGRFLLPLLAAHDHQAVEVFCYSSVRFPDAVTDQCRAGADVWRDVLPLSDEQVADAVRADRIDLLVDLTMHMAGSRLLAFARKPAPVQVAYLAYCGTTGLAAMDYRFTDPYFDPPGADRQPYSERSVWLPDTYWCYRPTTRTPLLDRLPALKTGHITFGCLNNFCKVSEPTLDVWSRLLRTVRDSQLILHAHAGSHRDRVRDLFARQGVSPERVEFIGLLPLDEHFRTYERIDIALDPFPCGGGTTTCDALWMGVPVVTLVGQTAVGRAGLSILSNLGLPELAARDADGYVRIAAQLAGDLPRLAELRATLRERMLRSPLMDAPRFARNVEAAYREMWRRWCGGAGE